VPLHALVFGPEERANIQKVVAYASDPANVFRPLNPGAKRPPGDDLNHVVTLGLQKTLRAVFSLTEAERESTRLYRHLSMSSKFGGCPNPILVYTTALEFGFRGPREWTGRFPKDWACDQDLEEKCLIVLQPMDAADGPVE
jgi:hypothetical protein